MTARKGRSNSWTVGTVFLLGIAFVLGNAVAFPGRGAVVFQDDFESCDFSRLPWRRTAGIDTSECRGRCAVELDPGEYLELTYTVPDGTISFYRNVDSGEGTLIFLIDGKEIARWRGEGGEGENVFVQESFPVRAGTRTFRWVGEGDCCPEVDDIVYTSGVAVRVLAWIPCADEGEEYAHVVEALGFRPQETRTRSASELRTFLAGVGVLLIPEQEDCSESSLASLGSDCRFALQEFLDRGGIIVGMTYARGADDILRGAGILPGVDDDEDITGETVRVVAPDHFLAAGVSSRFTAENGSTDFVRVSRDATVIVRDADGDPVVFVQAVGRGTVIMLGFDFYEYNADMARLLRNAVGRPLVGFQDDFESCDFSRLPWRTTGSIDRSDARGRCAVEFDPREYLELTYDVPAGTISFFMNVERGEELTFSVNGVTMGRWGPPRSWERVSFLISAGRHVFRWENTGRECCVEVDDIVYTPGVAVRVLAWIPCADEGEEYAHVVEALGFRPQETRTRSASELRTFLAGVGVLLIPEQEDCSESSLASLGSDCRFALQEFLDRGGIIVGMTYARGADDILRGAGILPGVDDDEDITGETVRVVAPDHFLAAGVSSRFTAENGSTDFVRVSRDATVIVRDADGDPVVFVQAVGRGTVIMLGFDFYEYNADMARLLRNAVGR